jgi:hypothetical protein
MKTLKETYTDLMNQKHSMKEQGASFEALDLLEDTLFSLNKAIELENKETIEAKTDSMFS